MSIGALSFEEYQNVAKDTDQFTGDEEKIIHHLLNLTETVGNLSRSIEQEFRDGKAAEPYRSKIISRRLGDMLWYVSILATRNGLKLHEIANNNLALTKERWARSNDMKGKSLDAQYPKFEKLPAKMTIVFFDPRDSKGVKRILMSVRMDDDEWIQLGDRIDDNAPHEDGYRFHDVFHFAYVAFMGWSPVIRSLLKRKRKSNQETDRVQDGARAANIEEAVTAYIFRYAKDVDFFINQKSVDFNILKTVVRITSDLEVSCRTYQDWEMAILEGYRVFRLLKDQGEGLLKLDCGQETPAKRMTLEPLNAELKAQIGLAGSSNE